MSSDIHQGEDVSVPAWSRSSKHVRRSLQWIHRRKMVTAAELLAYDRQHGGHLFLNRWTPEDAAEEWYLHQARIFLNSFRGIFNGQRVRAFIHISEDAKAGITTPGYVTVEAISNHRGMRAQVIADITRRMEMLASELRMWHLSATERQMLFERLQAAITQPTEKAS